MGVAAFYSYTRKLDYRLFALTISNNDLSAAKYPTLITRVTRNTRCLYNSGLKYKYYYRSNPIAINVTEDLDPAQVKQLVPNEY